MDLRQGRLKEIMGDRINGDPKVLGFSVIFSFGLAMRQLRRSSEWAGVSAATFGVVRRAAGEIRFTSVRFQCILWFKSLSAAQKLILPGFDFWTHIGNSINML